jgi:hypothetical protein
MLIKLVLDATWRPRLVSCLQPRRNSGFFVSESASESSEMIQYERPKMMALAPSRGCLLLEPTLTGGDGFVHVHDDLAASMSHGVAL